MRQSLGCKSFIRDQHFEKEGQALEEQEIKLKCRPNQLKQCRGELWNKYCPSECSEMLGPLCPLLAQSWEAGCPGKGRTSARRLSAIQADFIAADRRRSCADHPLPTGWQ
jgi:hypothetical protein